MRYRKIEFNTVIESKNIHFFGSEIDQIQEAEAHIDWNLIVTIDDNGVSTIFNELNSIYIEVEKTAFDDPRSTETFIVGNKRGCVRAFNHTFHTVAEDDFEITFDDKALTISEVTIDFELNEIILS